MATLKHILLASHDSEGARAAEKLAYRFCEPGTVLHHLIVVPEFWKGMQGDDWLNNAATRDDFGRYVESQLEQEIRVHVRRMQRETTKRRIRYRYEIMQGKPTECLLRFAAVTPAKLIVLGSSRPKGRPGLRSRMLDAKIFRSVRVPVVVAPFPHA